MKCLVLLEGGMGVQFQSCMLWLKQITLTRALLDVTWNQTWENYCSFLHLMTSTVFFLHNTWVVMSIKAKGIYLLQFACLSPIVHLRHFLCQHFEVILHRSCILCTKICSILNLFSNAVHQNCSLYTTILQSFPNVDFYDTLQTNFPFEDGAAQIVPFQITFAVWDWVVSCPCFYSNFEKAWYYCTFQFSPYDKGTNISESCAERKKDEESWESCANPNNPWIQLCFLGEKLTFTFFRDISFHIFKVPEMN